MFLISAGSSVHLRGPATEKALTPNFCPGERDVVFGRHCGKRDVVFVRLKYCSTFLSHVFANDVVMFCSVVRVIDKLPYFILWSFAYVPVWKSVCYETK